MLKMTKRIPQSKDLQANGAAGQKEYVGHGEDYVVVFDFVDVAVCTFTDLHIAKATSKMANGTYGSCRLKG